MIILTEELKKKFIRDLSKDIRLRNYTFVFRDTVLHCISKTDGTTLIHYDVIPNRCSYTELVKCAKSYLYGIMAFYNSARNDLKNMSYEEFIRSIIVDKRKEEPIDCPFFYKKNNVFFRFSVHGYRFHDNFDEEVYVLITQDVLDAHGVDIETFFKDVANCYLKEDIDILAASFPTF